jgi:dienelactone hydrolase
MKHNSRNLMIKQNIPYSDQETALEGFVATLSETEKRPLVLLCHAWRGRDEFICEKAELVAHLGFVGFAMDMYGKDVLGRSKEENAALKKPFLQDRDFLRKRLLKGFEAASSLPYVDRSQIVVVGFGFGGLCALDLARTGIPLTGAVSVYGHYDAPKNILLHPIKAKILILHGYNDPVSTMHELAALQEELDQSNVDWQSHVYSHTYHAFATPSANDPSSGILYHPISAKRAWGQIEEFLKENLK